MRRALRNAAIAATFLALALPLMAQESRGTIFGRVTDPQGTAVPAVDVLILNVDTNAVKKAVSNESGYYEIQGQAVQIVDAGELYQRLYSKAATYQKDLEKVPIIIKPRSDVRWAFVVETFNQAARAGFKSIAFAPVGS
jgi:biopolymer transport protein ExbD